MEEISKPNSPPPVHRSLSAAASSGSHYRAPSRSSGRLLTDGGKGTNEVDIVDLIHGRLQHRGGAFLECHSTTGGCDQRGHDGEDRTVKESIRALGKEGQRRGAG